MGASRFEAMNQDDQGRLGSKRGPLVPEKRSEEEVDQQGGGVEEAEAGLFDEGAEGTTPVGEDRPVPGGGASSSRLARSNQRSM